MMEVVSGNNWSNKSCKSSPPTKQHLSILQCQSTKGKYHSPGEGCLASHQPMMPVPHTIIVINRRMS